jgi:hypothetical protein
VLHFSAFPFDTVVTNPKLSELEEGFHKIANVNRVPSHIIYGSSANGYSDKHSAQLPRKWNIF